MLDVNRSGSIGDGIQLYIVQGVGCRDFWAFDPTNSGNDPKTQEHILKNHQLDLNWMYQITSSGAGGCQSVLNIRVSKK